jgi:hypothetical protein
MSKKNLVALRHVGFDKFLGLPLERREERPWLRDPEIHAMLVEVLKYSRHTHTYSIIRWIEIQIFRGHSVPSYGTEIQGTSSHARINNPQPACAIWQVSS